MIKTIGNPEQIINLFANKLISLSYKNKKNTIIIITQTMDIIDYLDEVSFWSKDILRIIFDFIKDDGMFTVVIDFLIGVLYSISLKEIKNNYEDFLDIKNYLCELGVELDDWKNKNFEYF